MDLQASDHRLKTLIEDTVSLLCKNGVDYVNEYSVEGVIVITVDKSKTFHASINEHIRKQINSPDVSKPKPHEHKKTLSAATETSDNGSPRKRLKVDSPSSEPLRQSARVTEEKVKISFNTPTKRSAPATENEVVIIKSEPKDHQETIGSKEKQPETKDAKEKRTKGEVEEETPKRTTRNTTQAASSPKDDTSNLTPITTRRSTRMAEEQSKIQTRGSAKKTLTPIAKDRPKRYASPVTASAPKKSLTKNEKQEKSDTNSKQTSAKEDMRGSIQDENEEIETRQTKALTSAKASPQAKPTSKDESAMKEPDNSAVKTNKRANEPTAISCETVTIDTRGVREVIRTPAITLEQPKVTLAKEAPESPSLTFTQLKTTTDPILVSSKEFMKISFPPMQRDYSQLESLNGQESIKPTVQSPKPTPQVKPEPIGKEIGIIKSGSLTNHDINHMVMQMMGNIFPGQVKNETGNENTIKVNLGLGSGSQKTTFVRHHCPSCKKMFNSHFEITNHICELPVFKSPSEAMTSPRIGSVYKCRKCALQFLVHDNFLKHQAACCQ